MKKFFYILLFILLATSAQAFYEPLHYWSADGNSTNDTGVNPKRDFFTTGTTGFESGSLCLIGDCFAVGLDGAYRNNSNNASEIYEYRTFDMWINPDVLSEGGFFEIGDGTSANALRILTTAAGGLQYRFRRNSVDIFESTASAGIGTGQWQHVIAILQDSNFLLYHNASLVANESHSTGPLDGNFTNITYGKEYSFAKQYDGILDNLAIFEEEFTQTNVTTSYNSGNGTNFSGQPAAAPTTNITIGVKNLLNSTTINYFNVTIANATFTQTYQADNRSLLTIDNISGGGELLYNLTILSRDHISIFIPDYNLTNTTHNFSIAQAILSVGANKIITQTSITQFTAITTYYSNSTQDSSNLSTVPANVGLNNLRINHVGFYGQNYTFNITQPNNNQSHIFNLSDTRIEIKFNNISGASIATFNATINNDTYYYVNSDNTTNGSIFFDLEQNVTFNISIFGENMLDIGENFTPRANTSTITFTGRPIDTINFTILYEPNRKPILNGTKVLDIISQEIGINITLGPTNNTVFQADLPAASYELRYRSAGFEERLHFVDTTLTQGIADVDLYLLDNANSTDVDFTITDQFGDQLENATIRALRYYLDVNGYLEVEACKTNFVGACRMHLKQFNTFYIFTIEYNGETLFMSSRTEIENDPQEYDFQVNTGSPTLENLQLVNDVLVSLNYFNSTSPNYFNYTFLDTTGLVTTGCLLVQQRELEGFTTINKSCITAQSGEILVYVNESEQTTFSAFGSLINQNSQEFQVIDLSISLDNRFQTFGIFGLFWLMGIILILVGLAASSAIAHPAIALLFMVLGLLASVVTGFTYGLISSIILVVIMAFIVIFNLTRNR